MSVSRHVAASCRGSLSTEGGVSPISSRAIFSHAEIFPGFFKSCGNLPDSDSHLYAAGQCPVDSIRRGTSRIQKEKP